MKILFNLLFWAPLVVIAQGAHFENGLSWQQIREKAIAENKYIFVDYYATWCRPCKMMDRNVYSNDSVGQILNSQFVSVKVQMDTTRYDNDTVKAWYEDAHTLGTAYKIKSLPSFLFFTPDGHIVHRGLGYLTVQEFIRLAMEARNPAKQYYTLLEKYRSGNMDPKDLPYLAHRANFADEPDVARAVVADYLHNYLNNSGSSEICAKKNLDLLAQFPMVLSSSDKVFEFLYRNGDLADSALDNKGFSKRFVNSVITQEEIKPMIDAAKTAGKEPDWDRITRNIEHKFSVAFAQENIIQAKKSWYYEKKDWENLTKYIVKQVDLRRIQNDLDPAYLNDCAWYVFQYSDNKDELEKAVTWSDRVIKMEGKPIGGFLDTKANLLYKLGRKKEALALEAKAVALEPKTKEICEAYEKMQRGEPTAWVVRYNNLK
ncbi:thioredoxin family protein [Puia dinghuensis]|uniref:Thioredoxin-like fold domain-containing protein n=1 Tax=Puia dinghuensis TaxID=1792502 RepID=A0A8J2UJ09_9BACT|nr:thioredoxin fold domain-containing protein [Puia dinghuensis]GGB24032.1 hypothetical protein GCM10011511_54920 [Puia dinghuensis]